MKIVWTRLAIKDLSNAYDYIAVVNPSAAAFFVERIKKGTDALRLTPGMSRLGRISGTRELVITRTPFIVPYRVAEDRIEIIAVIHCARSWPDK